jgi:hypothetical protein
MHEQHFIPRPIRLEELFLPIRVVR